jgi:hypothetical protein
MPPRNGGHINPDLYQEYSDLVRAHGRQTTKKIVRLTLSNWEELRAVVEELGLVKESQLRSVEACDAYFTHQTWLQAKAHFATFARDMPEEAAAYTVHEGHAACMVRSPDRHGTDHLVRD